MSPESTQRAPYRAPISRAPSRPAAGPELYVLMARVFATRATAPLLCPMNSCPR